MKYILKLISDLLKFLSLPDFSRWRRQWLPKKCLHSIDDKTRYLSF